MQMVEEIDSILKKHALRTLIEDFVWTPRLDGIYVSIHYKSGYVRDFCVSCGSDQEEVD